MASEERNRLDCSPRRLSTVDFLWQIVTLVGAGEVRSGVGTLASPMGGSGEATGEQGESPSLLVSQNTYP